MYDFDMNNGNGPTGAGSPNPEGQPNSNPNPNSTNPYGNTQQNGGYSYGGNPGGTQGNNGYYGTGYSYGNYGNTGNNGYVYYGGNGSGGATPPQAPVPPQKPSKHKKTGVIVLTVIIVLCVAAGIFGIVGGVTGLFDKKTSHKEDTPQSNLEIQDSTQADSVDADGKLTAVGIYEKVVNSSVGVIVYPDSRSSAASGEGSGVIISEDKDKNVTYVVTAAHVISGGSAVRIQLHDETQYEAKILGYDAKTDVAVLQMEGTDFTVAELGNSENLKVGEKIYAIGNPGGTAFASSFTDGIVSAIARPVDSEIGYEMICLQHTAAINPGNSGGALVNEAGQVVGINSSKIAGSGFEGMGFAVPSSTVKEIFDEIIAHGYVTNRPKLGITYTPASQSQIYSMIVSLKELPAGSLIVKGVTPDSSLAKTDVKEGDLITEVNGKPLETADTLPDLIENSKVGDEITLTICRIDSNYNIHEFEVKATLIEDVPGPQAKPTGKEDTYNPFDAFGFGN